MFEDWSGAVVVTNEREMQLASKVATRFFYKPKLDREASEKAGEPKYKDVEFVEMHIPGDKNNVVVKPVNKKIKALYAQRYAAWKAGQEDALNGTPIEHLTGIMPSQVAELRYRKIRTVEELRDVPDEVLQRMGVGYRTLQQKAAQFLERAKEGFVDEKLRAELAKKDEQLAAMMKRLEALEAQKQPAKEAKKASQ